MVVCCLLLQMRVRVITEDEEDCTERTMSSTLQRRRRAVRVLVMDYWVEVERNGTESTEETKTTEEVNEESDVFDEFNVSDVLREQQLQQANEYLSLLPLHRIGRERRRVLTNSSSSSSTCWEE